MPQSFCTICRRRIPKGSRCAKHAVRSPSNRAWHAPGAARLRKQLLSSPNAGCAICGATSNLELHHVVPAREGRPTTLENLVVLCGDHHEAVERGEISLGQIGRTDPAEGLMTAYSGSDVRQTSKGNRNGIDSVVEGRRRPLR
jgi:hypothetical protein